MKMNKFIALLLGAVMASQLITAAAGGVSADDTAAAETVNAVWEPPLSIDETLPKGNLFIFSRFNSENSLSSWDRKGIYAGTNTSVTQSIEYVEDANGGYVKTTDITQAFIGFRYTPVDPIEPGTYLFTGYFRTANEGEVTKLHLRPYDAKGAYQNFDIYCTNEWVKAEYYFRVSEPLEYFIIRGGGSTEFIQEYCMDNFSLVKVDSIPEDAPKSVGTPVTPEEAFVSMTGTLPVPYDPAADEKYAVNGIIINHDEGDFIRRAVRNSWDARDIYDYALQFGETHVTDYFININAGCVNYPSEVWTNYLDKYHATEENGEKVNYKNHETFKGAYYILEVLGTDYIGLWHEAFREVGINPWISVRMNDVHDMNTLTTSGNFSEFWYKNPQYRREIHREDIFMGYYGYAPDYTYEEVRDYYLALINEALNRYDTHGIELDFQREIWLFHPGGEYNGLKIMSEFMEKVHAMTELYAEKYGHEIKVAVRVAPDVETNFDFGLDIPGWAAKGYLDLVTVTSRWSTTDTDMPIALWDSILTPYGVELAAGIDWANFRVSPDAESSEHEFDTLCAFAANAYSMGADKVYFFNLFRGSLSFTEDSKININSAFYSPSSEKGLFNTLTTIGSYDKLMTVNRRSILTYSDTKQAWEDYDAQLPKLCRARNITTIRIPMGDIPEGAKVTLKFSTSDESLLENPPTVFVNSKTATYSGAEKCKGSFTQDKLLCYTVPESAHDYGYALVEIYTATEFTLEYAEVYIDVLN